MIRRPAEVTLARAIVMMALTLALVFILVIVSFRVFAAERSADDWFASEYAVGEYLGQRRIIAREFP